MSIKKIIVVFDGLDYGGIERVGINYLEILDSLDYDVTVLNLLPKKNQMINEIPSRFIYMERSVSRFKVIETYDHKFEGKIYWKIIRLVINFFLSFRMLFVKKIKVEYDLAIAFSGHFNDLRLINSSKIKSEKKLAWIHGSLFDYISMSRKYYDQYKIIRNLVCLSNINDEFVDGTDLNIVKIYNPVDMNKREIDNELVNSLSIKYHDYLLMVARFSKQKDHLTILKALKFLKEEFQLTKKLLFVGDGETYSDIKKIVEGFDLKEDVVFIGAKSDVQNYYKNAFAFVHASPAEGLPTVIIEAMLNSLPIVTTRSMPGVLELIPSEEFGLVCDLEDYKCIAKNIYDLYTNKERYSYYQKKSLERSSLFTYEYATNKLMELFKSLR